MTVSISSTDKKALLSETSEGTAAHELIKLLIRRKRPVPTKEAAEIVRARNLSAVAKRLNPRIERHGVQVKCVKTGGRSGFAMELAQIS